MCRSSECDLYWVSTQILRYPALTRLDSTKSINLKFPPNGTAGLARSAVNGHSRFPSPPANTIPRTLGLAMALTLAADPGFRAWNRSDLLAPPGAREVRPAAAAFRQRVTGRLDRLPSC